MAQLKHIKNVRPAGQKAGGSRSRTESLRYAFGENGERAVAFSSIGCVGATWQDFDQAFAATCAAHRKKPRIELHHLEQSFSRGEADPDDPEAAERVNKLGRKFAKKAWPGRQVVVVTQLDGESGLLHNHFLVNNPHTITGLMCRGDDMTWERLMPLHDTVLANEGHEQPEIMPTTVAEAKERAQLSRQGVYAEAEAHLRAILAKLPRSLEEANEVAPEGVSVVDEPKELRAKRGTRDKTGMRMRIRFTDSQGRKKAFDIARTNISREEVVEAFEQNALLPRPVPAPAPVAEVQVSDVPEVVTTFAAAPVAASPSAAAQGEKGEPIVEMDEQATESPAAAAAVSVSPWRSKFEGLVAKSAKHVERKAQLIAFDTMVHMRLEAGLPVRESEIAAIKIGKQTLEMHSVRFDPSVLDLLQNREAKKDAIEAARADEREHTANKALREAAMSRALWGRLKVEMAEGDFDLQVPEVPVEAAAPVVVPPKAAPARETPAQRIHREAAERAATDTAHDAWLRSRGIDPDSVGSTVPDRSRIDRSKV